MQGRKAVASFSIYNNNNLYNLIKKLKIIWEMRYTLLYLITNVLCMKILLIFIINILKISTEFFYWLIIQNYFTLYSYDS